MLAPTPFPSVVTMLLQSIRPNIVQSIRAHRPEDLQMAAAASGHHFLYAHLEGAVSKEAVIERIADAFLIPEGVPRTLDTLHSCVTDMSYKAGPQMGFILVLEELPDGSRLDREAREQLLDIFRDAADYWADRKIPFRCFYSFAVAKSQDSAAWERAMEAAQNVADKPLKGAAARAAASANFGMNMPMMNSVFDTAMWLNAA